MTRWATAGAVLAIALLTFFQFPGHTWLQQDTQIYAPILEHERDPSVLRNEILAQQPHVAFTLYDEVAVGLRRVSGLDFRDVLAFQQVVTRALGIWGLYLIALALGMEAGPALLVAAIGSLGASIAGPAVLTLEYEPTPRAFAVPLLMCAAGLTAQGRYFAAGVAAAAASLYHVPTALPFWAIFAVVAMVRRQGWALFPLGAALAILLILAGSQANAGEAQTFLARLTPLQEQLQRMRTAYVWISTWRASWIVHHVILCGVAMGAFARIRREVSFELRMLLVGLPIVGLLSMPVSWLLLERWRWALIPQVQPLRTLLFGTLSMLVLTAAAGVYAVKRGRPWESLAWFALSYLLPLQPVVTDPWGWRGVAVAAALGAITVLALGRVPRFAPAVGVVAFFAIPLAGGVVNYPHLHTSELEQLSEWARTATPRDAVFLFPDAQRGLYPGIFRSEALRAVYVDWKGGGQVNYLRAFGEQWWFRWQQTMAAGFRPEDLAKYEGLGITYVVLRAPNRLARVPMFENAVYAAYVVR